MSQITVTRKLEFDAGHRLLNHEGKCRFLHGHRYTALIEAQATELDSVGRIIDFSCIKATIGSWIDDNWDHNMILHKDDPLCANLVHVNSGREPYILDCNPTAENMAEYLYQMCNQYLPKYVRCSKITLYETPNCFAVYNPFVG